MRGYTVAVSFLAVAGFVLGDTSPGLYIHNWCEEPVYIWQSNNGDCDKGPNGICVADAGAAPYVAPAGEILQLDWITNSLGTAVKIAKVATDNAGILQFEYTMGDGNNWWDLSDLDGVGAGLVGTPFANDNVRIVPVGPGVLTGGGKCEALKCPAGQTCTDAYQNPFDVNTHYCPQTVGTFWLDLCMPDVHFTKRGLPFSG